MKEYFNDDDFKCPCCGMNKFDPELRTELNALRHQVMFPFIVNSACRCEKHNEEVGGVADSAHTIREDDLCHAVDIKVTLSSWRDMLLEALYKRRACGKGFWRIGIAKTFVHLDNDKTKPQGVVFLY
jgi:hypothetical protein